MADPETGVIPASAGNPRPLPNERRRGLRSLIHAAGSVVCQDVSHGQPIAGAETPLIEGVLLLARVTRQLSHLANDKRAALALLCAPNWEER